MTESFFVIEVVECDLCASGGRWRCLLLLLLLLLLFEGDDDDDDDVPRPI